MITFNGMEVIERSNLERENHNLREENEALRWKLTEAEETLNAIKNGAVDALVVNSPEGDQVFTLEGADYSYRIFVETMNEGAATATGDFHIMYCNKRLAEILNVPVEEIIGKSIENFIEGHNLSSFKEFFCKGLTEKSRGEVQILSGDGRKIPVLISCNPLNIEVKGVCLIFTELTELKKTYEELLRSNKELEQFAYIASHDLQEPLRMVSSFTQLLSKRYKDKLDKDAEEFIQYAVDGAARMQLLINDLLAFSRVKTRGNSFENINLNHVLDSALSNLKISIQEKDAKITSDVLPIIYADGGQIIQVFQNLIGNAMKFCKKKPEIHIGLKEDKDNFIISVKDNGIGIQSEYYEKIFQIFQRLHQKEEYEGSGVGLAICKRIIERHSGKIWIESEYGAGSIFYFSMKKPDRCSMFE